MAAYEAISKFVLSSPTSLVSITGIPQTYKNLYVTILCRSDHTGPDSLRVRINNSTGTYYSYTAYVNPSASSTTFYRDTYANNAIYCNQFGLPGGNSITDLYGATAFDIVDYSSTVKRKAISGLTGHADTTSNNRMGYWGGHQGTNAVTSLQFFTEYSKNFVAGSVFAVYGFGE